MGFLELFPRGGSKRGSGWHLKISPFAPLGSGAGGGGALRGTLEQRRSRLLAPRQGGGVRLRGAVWLSRSPLNPVCRYDEVICSEMTRRGAAARDKNKMPFQLVSLYYISNQTNYVSRPCPPPCHPERSGTNIKNHAHPPTIAAQSNPAPSGAPAGGISIAERYYMKQRNPRKSLPPGGEGGTPVPDEGETGERSP